MSCLNIIGLIIGAYLCGAIPFGLLIAKSKGINIREKGSGNIGATNIYRTLGASYGIFVFILDTLKGFIPTYLCILVTSNTWIHILVGCCTILGHTFTLFAQFKGGKGVATSAGMILALHPLVFIIICPTTIVAIKLSRLVAPCSIIAAISTPILLWCLSAPLAYISVTSSIALFIIWTHRSNIKRLLQGKENKI